MRNAYSKLIQAVRGKQLHEANELLVDILQQKVAERLDEERQHLMEDDSEYCPARTDRNAPHVPDKESGPAKCQFCKEPLPFGYGRKKMSEDFGAQKVCPDCKHALTEHDNDGCNHKGCRCTEPNIRNLKQDECKMVGGQMVTEDDSEELTEVSAPGQESWIRKNKARFTQEYGKEKGLRVLFGKAWNNSKK